MKKFYKRFIIFICILTFCSYSFVPKKTDAFVPLVVGGVYVSYEVILATATLCAAMGIVIVNKDQLVAMAEKFNSIPDFASHVVGHSVVEIQEYWFQFLVDRVSTDVSTPLEYNYAPTEFVGTGLKSPFDYLNSFKSAYDSCNHDVNGSNVRSNFNSFISSYDSTFKVSIKDVISSVQSSGLPYVIVKCHWNNSYYIGAEFYAYNIFINLDDNTLVSYSNANGSIPIFDIGRCVNIHASWVEGQTYNISSSFTSSIFNLYSLPDSIDSYYFGFSQNLSQWQDTVEGHIDNNAYTTNYTYNVWDYGNCSLPSDYDSSKVGDYGQVTSPALPTDQSKHWGDVFGADQSGVIDMGKALDNLKEKGIDTTRAATVDGVQALDISYPLDSVQDIPDVSVDDISQDTSIPQDSSIPYVPDFDTPDSSSSAELDFKPLMIVTKKFPFSLPWDLALAINSLSSDSVVPSYEFPSIPVEYKGNTIATIPSFTFSLSDLPLNDTLINILRTFEIISFCVFLIIKTRDIIRS